MPPPPQTSPPSPTLAAGTRRRHAFVCGCPRSGTTATASLLNWHPQVLLGQERYAQLVLDHPEACVPGLFEASRFGEYRDGDGARSNFEKSLHWDDGTQRTHKFRDIDACHVRGDKTATVRSLLRVFDSPAWHDEDVTVFALLRDVEAVAASYETRLRDPGDAWKDDRFRAIEDWTEAVECLSRQFQFRRTRFRLRLVRYEALFERGVEGMIDGTARLYADLGLSMPDDTRAGIRVVAASTALRDTMRGGSSAVADVRQRVPAATMLAYERLKDLALVL